MVAKTQPVMFEFTSPVIGAFPSLFEARKFRDERGVEGKDAFFDVRFILTPDHPDVPALRAALLKAAQEFLPGTDPATIDWCLRDGTMLADKAKAKGKDTSEPFRGKLVLAANTGEKYPPGLGAVVNGVMKDVPRTGDERAAWTKYFFGGMNCLGQLALKGFQVGNNAPVVKAYLQILVSLGGTPDPKLQAGGSKSASAVFSKHVGHVTTVDPTTRSTGLPI